MTETYTLTEVTLDNLGPGVTGHIVRGGHGDSIGVVAKKDGARKPWKAWYLGAIIGHCLTQEDAIKVLLNHDKKWPHSQ